MTLKYKILFGFALVLNGKLFDHNIIVPTILMLVILMIPISAAIRLIMAQVSPRVRESVSRHPILHLIWLVAAIAVMVLPFLLPKLR